MYCQLSHSLAVVWDVYTFFSNSSKGCSSAYVAVRMLCFNFHFELGMVLGWMRVHNPMSLVEGSVI